MAGKKTAYNVQLNTLRRRSPSKDIKGPNYVPTYLRHLLRSYYVKRVKSKHENF